MAQRTAKRLYLILFVIGTLMLANIFLIFQNSQQIEKNQVIITTADKVVLNAEKVIQSMHLLDLGIRAYALLGNPNMFTLPEINANESKDEAFIFLIEHLFKQNYPIDEVLELRKEVDEYFIFIGDVGDTLGRGDSLAARHMINEDRGYAVWEEAVKLSDRVEVFEIGIKDKAQDDFEFAVKSSYWLQIVLFIITLPTLLYSVYYSIRSISLVNKLRKTEQEKSEILESQNEQLEWKVKERTDELLLRNKEISDQNDQLIKAKNIIEEQQKRLELKNEELASEITQQNEQLLLTNAELISQNNKLEQFAYIISHNLRAPIARLLGLGNLMNKKISSIEKEKIAGMMRNSAEELNETINDMSDAIRVQNTGSKEIEPIQLKDLLDKVKKLLHHEIRDTHATINEDLSRIDHINSIPLYIENIFYNLYSNAIKYKKPDLHPIIKVQSEIDGDYVKIIVQDNGIGINLQRDRRKLFGLYSRFHFHVEGKGLGLYLVKKQIETLGGKIEVESVQEQGTTFTIWFKK